MGSPPAKNRCARMEMQRKPTTIALIFCGPHEKTNKAIVSAAAGLSLENGKNHYPGQAEQLQEPSENSTMLLTGLSSNCPVWSGPTAQVVLWMDKILHRLPGFALSSIPSGGKLMLSISSFKGNV